MSALLAPVFSLLSILGFASGFSGAPAFSAVPALSSVVHAATEIATTATEAPADLRMTAFDAAVLGLVEGLTEYLPVSSTGHLLVTNKILGLGGDDGPADAALETYAICIQIGAIFAVLFLYWSRIRQMIDGLLGRSEEGRHILIAVLAAFVPTGLIGLLIQGPVREHLFGVWPIAAAWLAGGVLILWLNQIGYLSRSGKELGEITWLNALVIGSLQIIAMWPGMSRSFTVILAGVAVGLTLRAAVEFSFLLGLVTLTAATIYEGADNGGALIDQFGWVNPLIGLIVAFVSAMIAVKWMVDWLQQKGFAIFGWYRVGIGLAAFAALGVGAL